MSTIKVNTIQHSSGANAAITLSSNGDVAFSNNVSLGTNTTFNNKLAVNYRPATADNAAIYIASANTQGGTGYADFIKVQNISHPGVTNPNKTFRLNSTGGIEVINSAYSAMLMSLDDSGRITTPYQPRVYATKTTGDWTNYGSSGTTFIFNNAIINVGNNYNSSTGIFTSPISGYYRVSAAILLGYGSGTTGFYLYKNGSAYGHSVYVATYSTSVHATTGFNWMVNCSAGDTLKIHAWSGSSATVYEAYYNHLLIELIG